jgi:hypothetical protein
VVLKWDDNSSNEVGFYLYQHRSGQTYGTPQFIPANATQVTVTGLSAGQTYLFKIVAAASGNNQATRTNRLTAESNELSVVFSGSGGGSP